MSDAPDSVLSVGEVLIDLIASDGASRLEEVTTFAARPGGAPANVAVALARLGVPSAFCGVVGDDPFGRRLRATLAIDGVDISRLRSTADADTSLAFAWTDARGDGHFRLLRLADLLLSDIDVDAAGIDRLAALVVGSVALAGEPSRSAVTRAVALAARAGVPVCFDVNLRPTLWPDLAAARDACHPIMEHSTLLKLSLDDARHLLGAADDPEEALAKAQICSPPISVLTDGNRGCWYTSRSNGETRPIQHIPAFAVDALEPTGAGDAFTAALISRLLAREWTAPDDSDVRYAAAAGALATTKPGALDGLPTTADLDAFLIS